VRARRDVKDFVRRASGAAAEAVVGECGVGGVDGTGGEVLGKLGAVGVGGGASGQTWGAQPNWDLASVWHTDTRPSANAEPSDVRPVIERKAEDQDEVEEFKSDPARIEPIAVRAIINRSQT
jgi:hypothetical protein